MFAQNLGLETVELKAMLRKPRRNRTAQLDLRMLSGLQRIRFFDSSLMDVPALPPSVRILDLENSSFEEFKYHSSDSETMLPYLPRLEYFHCTRAPSMGTGNHYIKILRRAHTDGVSNLKSLRLISNQDYHIPLLPEALGAMTVPNLQHITLGNELMVTDDVLDVITNRCPALQSLDLEKSAVTGAGVLRLIRTREGTLRRLNLTDCSAKVSADVVGYARELGIQVDYANTGEPGKCKTWTGYAFDPDLLTA